MVNDSNLASNTAAGRWGTNRLMPSLWKGFGLLLTYLALTQSQDLPEIGVDICACSPGVYNFTLDFSLFCPPVNITLGDAVQNTSCIVSPFGTPEVADLIPVAVSSIDVLELDQNMEISVQEKIKGTFGDGDSFQYTSIAALPGDIVSPEQLPRAIQLNLYGVNQFDEPLINFYLITFTNKCGRYPVLFEGQSAGWTRFSDLQPPSPELCPQVPQPTPGPTSSTSPPTNLTPPPTMSPTVSTATSPPTSIPMSMSMSMAMSMSMGLTDNDLVELMSIMEEAEFGRIPEMKERSRKSGNMKKQKKETGHTEAHGTEMKERSEKEAKAKKQKTDTGYTIEKESKADGQGKNGKNGKKGTHGKGEIHGSSKGGKAAKGTKTYKKDGHHKASKAPRI